MTWWGWIIGGAILFAAELAFVNAQFYLVFVGSAAIVTGLLTIAAGLAPWLQWGLFAILAIVSMDPSRTGAEKSVPTRRPSSILQQNSLDPAHRPDK